MNIYDIPKNEIPMDYLYVALSLDENGNEGIIAASTPMGSIPMVFGHERMLDKVKESLRQMSKDTGQKIYLVKYKKHEELEKIDCSN